MLLEPWAAIEELSITAEQLLAALEPGAEATLADLLFSGADSLTGADQAGAGDVLLGHDGDDLIDGREGRDTLQGGAGDDTIAGGDDLKEYNEGFGDGLDGGLGDDRLSAGEGRDVAMGGEGADLVDGGGGEDWLSHAGGALAPSFVTITRNVSGFPYPAALRVSLPSDFKSDDGSVDTLIGGSGDDRIWAGLGDQVDGGEGVDRVEVTFDARGSALNLNLSTDAASRLAAVMAGAMAGIELFSVRGTKLGDFLVGTAEADVFYGGGGADTLRAGGGDDTLTGGDWLSSSVVGGVSGSRFDDGVQDILIGGQGDDLVTVGGLDLADGGFGIDTALVTFSGQQSGVDLDLTGDTWAALESVTGGKIQGFEALGEVHATRYRDVITVAGEVSVLGYDGDDILRGDGGAQSLSGGVGGDQLSGEDGADSLFGGAGRDRLHGGAGNDRLSGDGNGDPGGDDIIDGGAGNDIALGDEGDDTVIGGAGIDRMDGGLGRDTVAFTTATEGVRIQLSYVDWVWTENGPVHLNLIIGNGYEGDAAGDHFSDFEVVAGSEFADDMRATGSWTTALPVVTLDGRGGDDVLVGSFSGDELRGGSGDDHLDGGSGGGGRTDTLNGGRGFDIVSYAELWGSNSSVTVDLRLDSVAQNTGGGGSQVLIGVEALAGSPNGDDTLFGNDDANLLLGLAGLDTIWGGGGDDVIHGDGTGYGTIGAPGAAEFGPGDSLRGGDGRDTVLGGAADDIVWGNADDDKLFGDHGADTLLGGAGRDVLSGGLGADRFVFTALSDSSPGRGDRLIDFSTGDGDAVDLSAIDADTTRGGRQSFTNVDAFTGHAGEAMEVYYHRKDVTALLLDVDGDKIADFELTVAGRGPILQDPRVVQFPATVALAGVDATESVRLEGVRTWDRTGVSVAAVGDVNGDDFEDFIIGASGAFIARGGAAVFAGVSYVVFGDGGPISPDLDLSALNGRNGFLLAGEMNYDAAGRSVAGAGDVNGDGFDDLLVGAPGHDDSSWVEDGGAAYVVFGGASFDARVELSELTGADGFRLRGTSQDDRAGESVASAGDINGDGFDDVIVGAYLASEQTGHAYVVFGRAGGFAADLELSALDGADGFRLEGSAPNQRFGNDVSGAGDVNGDGYDDLLIGAETHDGTAENAGAAFVIFGKASGWNAVEDGTDVDGVNGFRLNGEVTGDMAGFAVSSAGDVNADGHADLIVGALRHGPRYTYGGAAYVVFGSEDGFAASIDLGALNGSDGFKIVPGAEGSNEEFGGSVAAAGDVNGDGFDDVVIGAVSATASAYEAGGVYVLFGKADGFASEVSTAVLDGGEGFRIGGEAPDDLAGISVTGGDLNGDGLSDILLGAAGSDVNGSNSGAAYIVYGRAPTEAVERVGTAIGQSLVGSDHGDSLSGLGGDDRLFGRQGADRLDGGLGSDTLAGDNGSDSLSGGAGWDELSGGAGADVLEGGTGADVLDLGVGDGALDVLVFRSADDSRARTADRVQGFASGEDKVDLAGLNLTDLSAQMQIGAAGADLIVRFDLDGDGAFDDFALRFIALSSIAASDFII